MSYNTLTYSVANQIATIALNRRKVLNAFTPEMAHELYQVFEIIEHDAEIRVVVLCGAGDHFCAGGDIGFFASHMDELPEHLPEIFDILSALISLMQNLSKPIIAKVQGACAGIGMSFMMACDLAIAAKSTQFSMAYSQIGLTPDCGASYFLPKLVGQRKALELLMLAERFGAEKAESLHLVNYVVDDEALDAESEKLTLRIANSATAALARTKQLVAASWENTLEQHIEKEGDMFSRSVRTEDFSTAVKAFINKSRPDFKGK